LPADNICGHGNVGPGIDKAFSVSRQGNPGCPFTVLHELGHNFGLRHDRFANGETDPAVYNLGYVNVTDEIYTVMAYNSRCDALGLSCTRVPYISTPDFLAAEGSVIGVAPPDPEAAFNARKMNETASIVAGYY
jgi:hypothetical protein